MCKSKAEGGQRCSDKNTCSSPLDTESDVRVAVEDTSPNRLFLDKIKSNKDTVWKTDKNNNSVIIPTDKDIDNLIALVKANPALFQSYHKPLSDFFKANFPDEKLPWGLTSRQFYGVNLLSTFAPMSFSREHLSKIFTEVFNVPPGQGDPIQYVNKSGQRGLQHHSLRIRQTPYYHLAVMETGNHKRVAYKVDADHKDKLKATIAHRKNRLAIAEKALKEGTIDVGHRNPFGSDPSSSNLIAQVSSENRALRDKYIFDNNGDIAAPAPITLIKKRTEYYSDEAMSEIVKGVVEKDGIDFLSKEAEALLIKKLVEKHGTDFSTFK